MTNNELKTLIRGALLNETVPGVNFSDAKQVVIDSLMEQFGITPEMSYKQMKRNLDFSIIEEVIDEVLPKALEDILGSFAVIKQYARDEEVKFTIRGLGKRRAMYGITYGARGGIYKARRLDDKNLFIPTKVYTCAVYVTLEEILLGKYTLADLMNNILEGMQYIIYVEVVKALRTIATLAPANNRATGEGFVKDDMDRVIRVVSAYGKPAIICFESFAAKIENLLPVAGATPNTSVTDVEDYRRQGYVALYKGTPVVVLPNFILDEENEEFAFSESDAFILSVDNKPVYVAMKGEGYIKENEHATGSVEQQFHKIMGVGILIYNNLGIYTDSKLVVPGGQDSDGRFTYNY